MTRKRNEALAAKARALASQGKTQREVSAALGVPLRTLQSWDIEWPRGQGRPRVSDEAASERTRRRRRGEREQESQ